MTTLLHNDYTNTSLTMKSNYYLLYNKEKVIRSKSFYFKPLFKRKALAK